MPRKKFRRLPDGFGRIIHFGKRNLRNPYTARQIVGHSSGDVHLSKYTFHPPEYLRAELCKLKY